MYVFREKKMEAFRVIQMKTMTEKGKEKIRRKERTEKKGLVSTCVRMMMIRLAQELTGRKRNNIPNHRALLLGIIAIK